MQPDMGRHGERERVGKKFWPFLAALSPEPVSTVAGGGGGEQHNRQQELPRIDAGAELDTRNKTSTQLLVL